MDAKFHLDERHFIEDIGLFFEQMGMPRMAGKIVGALLISDPPAQSLIDIAAKLNASKGSISLMTRMLIEQGLIERVASPMPRQTYYRFRSGGWINYMRGWLSLMSELHSIAERGLVLIADKDVDTRERLLEAHDLFSIMEQQIPSVLKSMEDERLSRFPDATNGG
jgi:hypothetical protein